MKRLMLFIVLAILLFLPLTSQAVITIFPHNEGFEGSWPPEGWTDNDFSRSRSHRKIATHSAKCTMGATYRDWIASDVVDCTGRYNIPFSLWYWVSSVDEDGPKMKIESSINGGRTWSLIDEFRITEEKTFVKYSTTITRFNNQDNCKIRIWVGYKRGATCYLDEVKFGGSGLTINAGSVILTNDSTFDITGGVTISSDGTLNAGDGNINLTGDWSNAGTFTYGTSTVTLDGENQEISGDTTFYNFTKSVPRACAFTFGAGDVQSVNNTLTMTGSSGKVLTICSTDGGTQGTLDVASNITSGIDYVNVTDNKADGENHTITAGLNSVDSGNNTNWIFLGYPENVSLDLLSHNDEEELYAGEQYTWRVTVSDPNGTAGISSVVLHLDYTGGSGTDQTITWIEATDSFSSPSDYFTVDSTSADSTAIDSDTWQLDFKITLDWDWEAVDDPGTLADDRVVTTDDDGHSDIDSYDTDSWKCENDLIVYSATYTADSADKVSSGNAEIADDDWIRGETAVTATGAVTYEGTTDRYPPSAATIYVQLHVDDTLGAAGADIDDDDNAYTPEDTYCDEINYSTGAYSITAFTVPSSTDLNYDFDVQIEGIPTGGSDATPDSIRIDSRIDADAPTTVGCNTPADGATGVALIPTLKTKTATDNNSGLHDTPYYLELDDDDNLDDQDIGYQYSDWQASTEWTPSTTLTAGIDYYWRVKARDAVGNESSYCGHTADVEGYGTFTTTAAAVAKDLRINEVAFKETYDWIEIYVAVGGKNYGGCRIFDSGSERTTIPDSWGALTAGDYIVIHDESGTTDTSNKGDGDGSPDYWDIYDTDIDLNHDDEIIEIKGPSGDDTLLDVVIWSDNSGDQFAGGYTHANAAVTANEWNGATGCFSASDTEAWTDSDYVFAAKSIGRISDETSDDHDTNSKNDWYLYTTIHTKGAQNGSLVINEVMYNPAGDDSGNEWIEIFNHSGSDIDLTGYDLQATSGDYYTFPASSGTWDGTLDAGAYVVVHWRTDGSDTAIDLYTGTAAPFDDDMDNSAGYIGLWNSDSHASATFVDYIEYGAGGQTHESDASTTEAGGAGIWDTGDYIALVPENKCIGRIPNGTPGGYDNNQSGDWTETTNTTQGDVNEAVTEVIITITNWRELY